MVGALATQAMAQDGAQTQATAGKARLQAKAMTDEQMDQVTAAGIAYGIGKIVHGAGYLADGNLIGGLWKIGWGIKIIVNSAP